MARMATARRYVRINIGWLVESLEKKGIDHAATEFLQRLFYDENLPWLARAIEDLLAELPPRKWETTDQKSKE